MRSLCISSQFTHWLWWPISEGTFSASVLIPKAIKMSSVRSRPDLACRINTEQNKTLDNQNRSKKKATDQLAYFWKSTMCSEENTCAGHTFDKRYIVSERKLREEVQERASNLFFASRQTW